MSYQFSPELDKSRSYLVNSSELYGRFDPHFHKPEFKLIEDKINNSKWHVSKLKDLFNINRGGSPRPIQDYLTKDDDGVNWIKIGDTKGIDKYIYKTKQKINLKGVKFSRKVVEGDFILSNSMSFGKPFIMKTSGYIHDGWLLFRAVTNEASKDYLHTVLGTKFVYELFKKQTIGGVVENLNIDLVKHIKIPIPPKEIQTQIVTKMDVAYATKKQKEAQAQQLLGSIDDYLLGELGVELPEQEENTVQSRIFTRRLSEVSGGRVDPNYHLNIELITGHKANFEFIKLKDILKHPPQYGANEAAIDGIRGNGIRYIRITDISEIGELNNNSWKTAETIEEQYFLRYNDLLFARSGSVGRAYLHKDVSENAIYAGYLIRFILDEKKVDPDYIFFYCHSIVYKFWVKAIFRTAVQANINAEEYKSLPIALPPIEKQTEIANQITKIRNQAKQLKQQAKAEVEQAKKEVEAMILGET